MSRTTASSSTGARAARRAGVPRTLVLGVAVIVVAELLLWLDVIWRSGAIAPGTTLPAPTGAMGALARATAVNMTPIAWIAYLLIVDGLLTWRGRRHDAPDAGSPVRRRPRRILLCVVASIPIWLVFDWINFTFLDAWRYHGLPVSLVHRWTGYAIAFGAICPGMFLGAELLQRVGLARLRGRGQLIQPVGFVLIFVMGALFAAFPFFLRDPAANLTLWVTPILLIDPINRAIGAPSLLGDLQEGRYGRLVSLMLAGLVCGLLWEFWNYWAAAKWTYNLPFLGSLEHVRYFEMPVLGLLGFLPFGPSCWVMFQLVVAIAGRLGLRVEPLPSDDSLL